MRLREEVAEELRSLYSKLEPAIVERLGEFRRAGKEGLERAFEELCFCLLTPQTKAETADAAIRELRARGLLMRGRVDDIAHVLKKHGVRFYGTKAARIVTAREHLNSSLLSHVLKIAGEDPVVAREMLVKHVKGLGYKEASHFLRNLGFKGLAILDRHILRTLTELGVLNEFPKILNRRRYLEIGFSSRLRGSSASQATP